MPGLLAAAIAFLGVCIAWGQWHTARQKLVLDMFEKRLAVVKVLVALWKDFNRARNARVSGLEDGVWLQELLFQRRKARLLFGEEFEKLVVQFIFDTSLIRSSSKSDDPDGRHSETGIGLDEQRAQDERYYDFVNNLYEIAGRYATMDQKLPKGPFSWIRQRYADRPTGD